jgi:hypothetical protein
MLEKIYILENIFWFDLIWFEFLNWLGCVLEFKIELQEYLWTIFRENNWSLNFRSQRKFGLALF